MRKFDQCIYAIVRTKGSELLELISQNIFYDKEPKIEELCGPFEYATSLSDAFHSSIPYLDERHLMYVPQLQYLRKEAYAFEKTLSYLKENYDLVAYSHRKGGWRRFNWEYNDDIKFEISSNFGYGSVSVFHVLYNYKGTLLCPYADYVKYQYSEVGHILSHTKSYMLEYSEWEYLMRSTLDFYNAVVNKQESYIINWVNDNLKQLINGLQNFVLQSSMDFENFKIEDGMRISFKANVNENDFWILKSKKISNSLDFIDNIKILPAEFGASSYVQQIEDICKDFISKLKDKIDSNKKLLEEKECLYKEITDNALYNLYNSLRKKYYFKYKLYLKNNFKIILFFFRVMRRLHIKYDVKDIRTKLIELGDIKDNEKEISKNIEYLKLIDKNLSNDKQKIEDYFKNKSVVTSIE